MHPEQLLRILALPIDLTTVDSPWSEGPLLSIPTEALFYFARVSCAIGQTDSLLDVDPYEVTVWAVDDLHRVEAECEAVERYLVDEFRRDEHLGQVEPPRTINQEADAEPFGRRLALDLLEQIVAFIRQARREGSNVYARGD